MIVVRVFCCCLDFFIIVFNINIRYAHDDGRAVETTNGNV